MILLSTDQNSSDLGILNSRCTKDNSNEWHRLLRKYVVACKFLSIVVDKIYVYVVHVAIVANYLQYIILLQTLHSQSFWQTVSFRVGGLGHRSLGCSWHGHWYVAVQVSTGRVRSRFAFLTALFHPASPSCTRTPAPSSHLFPLIFFQRSPCGLGLQAPRSQLRPPPLSQLRLPRRISWVYSLRTMGSQRFAAPLATAPANWDWILPVWSPFRFLLRLTS